MPEGGYVNLKEYRVKINMDISVTLKAETASDAERAVVSILIQRVLQGGIVDTLDPQTIRTTEVREEPVDGEKQTDN